MQRFIRMWIAPLAVLTICSAALAMETPELSLSDDLLIPKGDYYEATVPDTLDLAEHARLSVRGLTRFLNPDKDFSPYGHAFFNVKPPIMTNVWAQGPHNWGKISDGLIQTRLICGSKENLELEEKTLRGMLKWAKEDGSTPLARIMLALMSLERQHPDPGLHRVIERMAASFATAAKGDEERAYFYDFEQLPPDNKDTKLGIIGYGWHAFIQGNALRTLSRWHMQSGDAASIQLATRLKNFTLDPILWEGEEGPKAVVGEEHAHFRGHHHSYLTGLLGLLWYAEATHDTRLMQFVRDGYEHYRTFGIARVGLFGEGCSVADMTMLAIQLSELGVGDYWDDVDSYVRNQLIELQITDADKLRRASQSEPILAKLDPDGTDGLQKLASEVEKPLPLKPLEETEEDVCERNVGAFLSEASCPTHIPKQRFLYTICCTGNCTAALCAAWDATVRCREGVAQINMLLNRASPWLDIDSYLPYEGKVVVRNKTAHTIFIRFPLWVDCPAIQARINDKPTSTNWIGQYLALNGLEPDDVISFDFPMRETVETYTLKWKQDDFWMESTDPGSNWKPTPDPDRYTFHFRGNTVMDVSPRRSINDYQFYARDDLIRDKAPMRKLTRFVVRED